MTQTKQLKDKCKALLMLACLPAISMVMTGCPAPVAKEGSLTLLLASNILPGSSAKQAAVNIADVSSLLVTVSAIDTEHTVSGESEWVNVFTGPLEIDLVDLAGLAELIESASVPEGSYTAVRITLANASLVLVSDPGTVITNVILPNSGVLVMPIDFNVLADGQGTLVVDLGGINLVDMGDGSYQLNPEPEAAIADEPVVVQAVGRIRSVDAVAGTFTLARQHAELTVHAGSAPIFLPGDFDSPSGTQADLVEGSDVFVLGSLGSDQTITALVVAVLKIADTSGGEGEGEGEDGDHFEDIDNSGDDVPEREIQFDLASPGGIGTGRGEAKYTAKPGRQHFKMEVEGLAPGIQVYVTADDVRLDAVLDISEEGDARLSLDFQSGDTVPVVTADSVFGVYRADNDELLLESALHSSEDGEYNNGGEDGGEGEGEDGGEGEGEDGGEGEGEGGGEGEGEGENGGEGEGEGENGGEGEGEGEIPTN